MKRKKMRRLIQELIEAQAPGQQPQSQQAAATAAEQQPAEVMIDPPVIMPVVLVRIENRMFFGLPPTLWPAQEQTNQVPVHTHDDRPAAPPRPGASGSAA